MIFKESLYGWGVCNIPMSRSVQDIFTDRRKQALRILFPDRRRQAITPGIISNFAGLLIRDVPWFSVLLTNLFLLLSIFSIFLVSNVIPDLADKPASKAVNIAIRVIEAPKTLSPVGKQEIIGESAFAEKIEEKPKPRSFAKKELTNKNKLLALQSQEPLAEESLPDVRIRPVIKKRPVKTTDKTTEMPAGKIVSFDSARQPEITINTKIVGLKMKKRPGAAIEADVSKTSAFNKRRPPNEIQISGPGVRKNKYRIKQAENLKAQLPDSMSKPFFKQPVFKQPDASVVITSQSNPSEKNYRTARLDRDPSAPIQDISANALKAPDFSDTVTTNEIDPSRLISLKQLRVCADPEEEFNLKTKLATLLDGPKKCLVNGMIFYFKYPESGYTIQVDIYNPQGEFLTNRCSVLYSAIESIKLAEHEGVLL